MRRRRKHSLKSDVYIISFIILLIFSLITIFNNTSAARLLRKRVYANTKDSVQHYGDILENELKRLETWMFTTALNDHELNTLRVSSYDDLVWHTAISRLQNSFNTALNTDRSASALFCYISKEDYYMINASDVLHADIRQLLANARESGVSIGSWTIQFYNDSAYYIKGLNLRGITVGAVVRLSAFLNIGENTRLYILEEDGTLLGAESSAVLVSPLSDDLQPGYKIDMVSGEKSFLVYVPLKHVGSYLAQVIPYARVSTESRSFTSIVIIIAFALLLTFGLIFSFLRQNVLRPLNSITKGINSLRSGNLDAYIPPKNFPEEFTEVSAAFNDTVSELRDLKIDVYERKLQTQNLEMQYLKQQITPHFMINCLNTAYQLTDSAHTDLAREMLSCLSSHLRYTLSSGQKVRLSEEIEFVRNYMKISEIRYPESLNLQIDCPMEIRDAAIVPLMLLNFVENTIKHEVRMGRLLSIYIVIEKSEDRLCVTIWDTGNGFSEESLAYLRNLDPERFSDSTHIGISNVVIRLVHVYPDAEFDFSNRKGAGAQIRISLPYEPVH